MSKVSKLAPSVNFTVEQTMDSAKQENLVEVMIIGTDEDGDFFVRSSKMDCEHAFFLAKKLENYALTGGESL